MERKCRADEEGQGEVCRYPARLTAKAYNQEGPTPYVPSQKLRKHSTALFTTSLVTTPLLLPLARVRFGRADGGQMCRGDRGDRGIILTCWERALVTNWGSNYRDGGGKSRNMD